MNQPSHDDIARRAYHLYWQRDARPGGETLDWLEAERELRDELDRNGRYDDEISLNQ